MNVPGCLCWILAAVALGLASGRRAPFYDKPAPSSIRQVHIVMRHGARAPLRSYLEDPNNNEELWLNGWGHLQKEGYEQHDNLGRWLRRRYDLLLDTFPNTSQIQVVSTELDRTINSALANMAGLFYLKNESDRYSTDLPYAPVPLRIRPRDADGLIRVRNSNCPSLHLYEEILRQTDDYMLTLQRARPLMETLSQKLGVEFTNLENVSVAYDTFMIEKAASLSIPAWAEGVLPAMKNVSRFVYSQFFTGTDELLEIRASPLLSTIMEHMEHKANSSGGANVYVYSGHDITVLVQLSALGLRQLEQPPFASAVVFELHERENGSHFVQVFYHADSNMTSDPLLVTGGQCPPSGECDLTLWVENLRRFDLRHNGYEKRLCGVEPRTDLIFLTAVIGSITTPFLIFCVFLAVILTREYYLIKIKYQLM